MTGRIFLLGATGYTGDLVLESLLLRGVRPTVAGRNPAALKALAERAGGLDHVVVDAADPAGLRGQLRQGDVLVTTVGPFERFGYPVAQAAADAGAHYIDSTGEVGFVRILRERHHRRARDAGAVMLPAFGYDYVPGILAGTLAAQKGLGSEGLLLLRGHGRAADGQGGTGRLRGSTGLRALRHDHGRSAGHGLGRPSADAHRVHPRVHARPDTARTSETDTAVVLYTSGTTGRPKGAQLTHSNMVQNALMASRQFGMGQDDILLLALPLFHSFGQTVQLNAAFAGGATVVLMPRFDAAAALETMERENVTFFAGVPTMYWALVGYEAVDRHDLERIAGNLRISVSGGSALPVEVLKAFEERSNVPILEGYGLSETSPAVTFNRLDRPRKPGSVGLPVWGVEVKVAREDGSLCDVDEPGEICVRGHNVMKGYLNRPEATAEAIDAQGWFHTGDIGRRDADGYFYVVDRIKDLIIRGGFNVYPRELEEVLLTHPDISLAAVVGVPHESHGEEVKAFVVRKPGATVTEDELVAWCKQNMAGYKYPRMVEFRDTLPMTATSKILKRELVG